MQLQPCEEVNYTKLALQGPGLTKVSALTARTQGSAHKDNKAVHTRTTRQCTQGLQGSAHKDHYEGPPPLSIAPTSDWRD
ncbi:hypothetical protein HaLaN_06999 [Haematococcus lacustris]|uniref:Uncharacterized protein n=1 Tax=Haematococcus lacustris TaxID=44745 RepID=A0A699YN06_HAELA|nr:hypothetical protein HaLaN_06999 [Haematococcus lacustris]